MKRANARRRRFQSVPQVRRQPVERRIDFVAGHGQRVHAVGGEIVESRRQLENGGILAHAHRRDGRSRIGDVDGYCFDARSAANSVSKSSCLLSSLTAMNVPFTESLDLTARRSSGQHGLTPSAMQNQS